MAGPTTHSTGKLGTMALGSILLSALSKENCHLNLLFYTVSQQKFISCLPNGYQTLGILRVIRSIKWAFFLKDLHYSWEETAYTGHLENDANRVYEN